MFIENPDAFKTWLTSILEPLCDADPAALAKYVYALVKKEKPLRDLRDGMLDQLDVFLQEETRPFVNMLFRALETQEYLKAEIVVKMAETPTDETVEAVAAPPLPPPDVPFPPPPLPPDDSEAPSADGVPPSSPTMGAMSTAAAAAAAAASNRVVMSRNAAAKPGGRAPPQEQTLVKVIPLHELLEEPLDLPSKRRDRRNDPLRDDRHRRKSRSWDWRGKQKRHDSPDRRYERRRQLLRTPSPTYRYRSKNRSPPPPGESRSRSRSPVQRERGHEREWGRMPVSMREMDRDRMSREHDHQDRLSRSRERDRSRDRSPVGDDRPSHGYRRRCRDYDEKGYCMRGDLCQWDHGADPVVLEDTALSRVLTMPSTVPEYNPLAPDIWGGAMGPGFPQFPPHHHPPLPARELVPIPRVREMGGVPPLGPMLSASSAPAAPRPYLRKNFEYARTAAPRPNHSAQAVKCSLEVRKVPRGLNDITHLNNHFSKFGKIVNIQVNFEGDPEAALITFSNHTEANIAYKSTEAVLNNRFIKVFWHNPENKQDNSMGLERATGSHNKVLINKDNIKQTQLNKEIANNAEKARLLKLQSMAASATTSSVTSPTHTVTATTADASSTEPMKKPVGRKIEVDDMHRRAQNLLDSQLQQQLLLISKLESGNVSGEQKAELMRAINSAQEGIEKLRKELISYNQRMKLVQEDTVTGSLSRLHLQARPKTREETQKELLDAELDMFTKQQEGEDTTEIAKKINDMRQQLITPESVVPSPTRRLPARGGRFNTCMRYTRGAAPAKMFNNQTVDHRPRTLLISGFEADDLENLIKHFSIFGEIVGKKVNSAVPELMVQYKLRQQAEMAAARGKNYNERTLSITWVAKQIGSVAPNIVTEDETEKKKPQEIDDEEDDEQEDRTWRR